MVAFCFLLTVNIALEFTHIGVTKSLFCLKIIKCENIRTECLLLYFKLTLLVIFNRLHKTIKKFKTS